MKNRSFASIAFALVSVCGAGLASATTVNFSPTNTNYIEVNGSSTPLTPTPVGANFTGAATNTPVYGSVTQTDGTVGTVAQYAIGNGGFTTLLTGYRPGNSPSFNQSRTGLYFTVSQSTDYALSGGLSGPGGLEVTSQIYDFTDSKSFFYQTTSHVGGGDVILGQAGPDNLFLSGSLTGTFAADHLYYFYFTGTSQAFPTSDGGGSFGGGYSLSLTDSPVAVPLPAAAWAGIALLGTLGFTRRRWSLA